MTERSNRNKGIKGEIWYAFIIQGPDDLSRQRKFPWHSVTIRVDFRKQAAAILGSEKACFSF
jgi:hypothetical protein